jgi:ubiquinone/menaquinone biosynthesis C-methylase UbiE
MLEMVRKKVEGTESEKIIELHKCEADEVGISEKVDLVLAFWMIHEVPDMKKLFTELKSILKPSGKLLIVEPKFHVSKSEFEKMINILKNTGFEISKTPKVSISRAVLLSVADTAG